jgi:hypothetical protein
MEFHLDKGYTGLWESPVLSGVEDTGL